MPSVSACAGWMPSAKNRPQVVAPDLDLAHSRLVPALMDRRELGILRGDYLVLDPDGYAVAIVRTLGGGR